MNAQALPRRLTLLWFGLLDAACVGSDDSPFGGEVEAGASSESGGSDSEDGEASIGSDSSGETGEGSYCGDSVVDDDEICDDGNEDEQDSCLTSCTPAACGDGIVHLGVEICDGDSDTGTCTADCERWIVESTIQGVALVDVAGATDGSLALAGTQIGIGPWIRSENAAGEVRWTVAWSDPGGEVHAVARDEDGNVYAGGETPGEFGAQRVFIRRLASEDGALAWEFDYGAGASDAVVTALEIQGANLVMVGASGDSLWARAIHQTTSYFAWQSFVEGQPQSRLMDVRVDGETSVIAVGHLQGAPLDSGWVGRIEVPTGDTLWEKSGLWPQANVSFDAVAMGSDGANYAVGTIRDPDEPHGVVEKRNSSGDLLWTRVFEDLGPLELHAAVVDGRDRLIVAGTTALGFEEHAVVAEISTLDAEILFSDTIEAPGEDAGANAIAVVPGTYVVVGTRGPDGFSRRTTYQ